MVDPVGVKRMENQQNQPDNNLIACLSYVTAVHGHARSPAALEKAVASGISGGVGAETTVAAAEHSGFSAQCFTEKRFEKISPHLCPVILLTGDRKGVVLRSVDGNNYRIFDPASHEEKDASLSEIQDIYYGRYIALKPNNAALKSAPQPKVDKTLSKSWFLDLFKENMPIYRMVLLAAILINVFALTIPLFIMNMYDRVIPNAALDTGWAFAIGATLILSFDFAIRIIRGRLIDIAGRRMDVLTGAKIFDQLLNIRLAERPASSGVFANMLREFDTVREFFTSATIAALVDLPFALLFVLVIAFIGGPLALVVLTIMVVIVAASYALQVALKKDILKAMRAGEERHGVLVETINGLETVKAIGADQRLRSLYTEHLGEMARYGQEARYYSNLGISLTYFMQQMMTVLIVVFGMYLIKDNALSVGALIAAVLLAGRAVAPMAQIASLMTRFYQTRNALNTITALMHKDVERPQNKAFIHRPELQGEVAFKNVSFAYPRSERKILDNVSFNIRHGEKVAIIGRIGSGKSTLARLLMGLYQPAEGQIFVNDTDQAQIDPADLRRNFAYIAQDVTLFRGTVRDNITAARIEASDEEILRAAQISGVHEFVKAHPLGLDAEVGEGGSALSGGQRQAVALARAMLTKPSLYICDEPTNAMDVQAENAFVQHIKGEVNNKTLILITHRLSLLEIVDRIIVVEQGKIIMDGLKKDVIKSLSGEGDS